jgi:hypothetical protein
VRLPSRAAGMIAVREVGRNVVEPPVAVDDVRLGCCPHHALGCDSLSDLTGVCPAG